MRNLINKNRTCEYLDISERTLDTLMRERRIPYVKLSKRIIRFSPDGLDEWLKNEQLKQLQEIDKK